MNIHYAEGLKKEFAAQLEHLSNGQSRAFLAVENKQLVLQERSGYLHSFAMSLWGGVQYVVSPFISLGSDRSAMIRSASSAGHAIAEDAISINGPMVSYRVADVLCKSPTIAGLVNLFAPTNRSIGMRVVGFLPPFRGYAAKAAIVRVLNPFLLSYGPVGVGVLIAFAMVDGGRALASFLSSGKMDVETLIREAENGNTAIKERAESLRPFLEGFAESTQLSFYDYLKGLTDEEWIEKGVTEGSRKDAMLALGKYLKEVDGVQRRMKFLNEMTTPMSQEELYRKFYANFVCEVRGESLYTPVYYLDGRKIPEDEARKIQSRFRKFCFSNDQAHMKKQLDKLMAQIPFQSAVEELPDNGGKVVLTVDGYRTFDNQVINLPLIRS